MIGTDTYRIVIELPKSDDIISVRDYRYSKLEITSLDLISEKKYKEFMEDQEEPLKAKFLGKGNVRLYREYIEDDLDSLEYSDSKLDNKGKHITYEKNGDDSMLCIVAIPTYFTVANILEFIGENYMKYLTNIRIIKSETPNRFLVLLKFNDLVKTAEFQHNYDNRPFNSMEHETCHVVYLKCVQVDNSLQQVSGAIDSLIPFLLDDPFTKETKVTSPGNTRFIEGGSVELPTCIVCLERMDSAVTGLLTIPCQHTFHCQCLLKWKDDTCPICRYSNNKLNLGIRRSLNKRTEGRSSISHGLLNPDNSSTSKKQSSSETCSDCSADCNLWICLICGNIGCDRYAPEQHSLMHFINTGHCFAMEMDTSRVWDYAGDRYVHRLLTTEDDGKIVELPDKSTGLNEKWSSSFTNQQNSSLFDKVDQVGFEYSSLLIQQLDSQREYYESLLKKNKLIQEDDNAIGELRTELRCLKSELDDLSKSVVPALKSKLAKKNEQIQTLSKDLGAVNSINNGLLDKIDFLSNQNKDLKTQNSDLEEQVKDLMFFLETQEKFKDQPDEVRDGTIIIQNQTTSKSRKSRKSKNR